jgi:hypothetical protein
MAERGQDERAVPVGPACDPNTDPDCRALHDRDRDHAGHTDHKPYHWYHARVPLMGT